MGKAGVIVDDNNVGEVGVFVVDDVGGQTWPSPSLSTQLGVVDDVNDVTFSRRRWTWASSTWVVVNDVEHGGIDVVGHCRRRGMWGRHRTWGRCRRR